MVGVVVVVIAVVTALNSGSSSRTIPVAVPTALLDTGEPDFVAPAAGEGTFASSTSPDIYVHIVGGVVRPGLYRLAPGSRIIDAVMAAGGLAPDGSQCQVNLARLVTDGEQVVVPQAAPGTPCRSVLSGGGVTGGASAERGPVSLSAATVEQLDALPGIGPALAQRIIDFREANGGFRSVDQLTEVSGIGAKVLANIAPLVTP